jgi:hypothetical protein
MDAQLSFAWLVCESKKKRTNREVFFAEMAAAVPWGSLEAIEPHYPKAGAQGGRRLCLLAGLHRACAMNSSTLS